MRFPLSSNRNWELRIYSLVICPSRPMVCSTTSRLNVCWFKASRTCVSVLRKAARMPAGVRAISGGVAVSETTSTFGSILLDRNEAIGSCWATADGVEGRTSISRPRSLIVLCSDGVISEDPYWSSEQAGQSGFACEVWKPHVNDHLKHWVLNWL